MLTVTILGSGNVATHFFKAFFASKKVEVVQWYSRNIETIQCFSDQTLITNSLQNLKEVDLYIIAISDDAIASFSKKLATTNQLVAHCSGSIPLKGLSKKNRRAILYPVQTFSKEKEVDFKNIPLCLEAESLADMELLKKIAASISTKVFEVNSEQRKSLHLTAVFVNNFTNHLYQIGQEICNSQNISFELLLPLIKETVEKLETLTPLDAQTGPAKRGDFQTIENHLEALEESSSAYINIYKTLTSSILKTYGRKEL